MKRIIFGLAVLITLTSGGLYAVNKNLQITAYNELNDLKKENLQLKLNLTKSQNNIIQKRYEIEKLNNEIIDYKTQNTAYENTVKKLMSAGNPPKNYKLPEYISRGSYDRYKNSMEYVGEWLCTYYAPTVKECSNNKGITASGKPIVPSKTIAIDPKYWKFGTKFYIEGIGIVEAWDTGSDIKGRNRADIATLSTDISHSGNFKAKVYLIK